MKNTNYKMVDVRLLRAASKFKNDLRKNLIDKILEGKKVSERWDVMYPNDYSNYFKLIELIESGQERKAYGFAYDLDSEPRDKIPRYLWIELDKVK